MTARIAAVVRPPGRSFPQALQRAVPPLAIALDSALREHAAYVDALRACGVEVAALPPEDELPDACFVEDTAVVADGRALATRPGHPARRAEVDRVAAWLARWVPVVRQEDGGLDGGDVLAVGRRLYVGRSERTDERGIGWLRRVFPEREVVPVPLRDGLHLKSGATALPDGRVLVAPDRVDPGAFAEPTIAVVAGEADACNVVTVGDAVVAAAGFPDTLRRLRAEGYRVVEVDNRELRKADSALTCLSVLVPR